ncbi:Nucleotidyltransferase [Atractiella rhizophila]|nr:Nucleotidyltransferase [Atractiella rhizophila]
MVTEEDKVVSVFSDIYGVGKTTASKWYRAGARTIEDLRERTFEGIKLSTAQEIGLRFYEDLKCRIPREEIELIGKKVKEVARGLDKRLELTIMGSYRRGAKDSGDIDFCLTRNPTHGRDHRGLIKPLLGRLKEAGIITFDLGEPDCYESLSFRYMGLCKSTPDGKQRRIVDILGVPWDERGAAWIYFTGNDIFNRSLRLKARHMGYSLNQCGLYKGVLRKQAGGAKTTNGEKVAGESEEEIFRILGVKWRPPEERNP